MEFKYNIKKLMDQIPYGKYGETMEAFKKKNIKTHNLYLWGKIKATERISITFEKALDIAEVLNVDVNELHNRKNSTTSNK